MATDVRLCPECGTDLPGDAPEGLCPKCLLQGALSQAEDDVAEPHEGGTSPYFGSFIPPTPAELAKHFPTLQIIELLGQGGMGAVYKARQLKLDRLIALKIMPPGVGKDPAFAERFTREARALAKLCHPNIVAVHDFGEADGLYYFIMEYVDGVNLRQLIQTKKVRSAEALKIIPQICDALQFAHDEGIVHRDIKPENILIDKKGRVKIADFGLAKILGRTPGEFTLTGTRQIMGTPHYMAPEQMEKPHTVDHRADIYSLGVVFYEMLTGELPLGQFSPPSAKAPVDVRLDEIVMRALAKEPERRYQHVSDVKIDVESIVRRLPPKGKAAAERPMSGAERDLAKQEVYGPGAALVLTGVANFLAFPFLTIAMKSPHMLGLFPFYIILGILIIIGAARMQKLQSYEFAIITCIVAMVPCSPTFMIGLPIGLWALWVLNKPHVKAAFHPAGAGAVGGAAAGEALRAENPVLRKLKSLVGEARSLFLGSRVQDESGPLAPTIDSPAPGFGPAEFEVRGVESAAEAGREVESVADGALVARPAPHRAEAAADAIRKQVAGPAMGLMVAGVVASLFWLLISLIFVADESNLNDEELAGVIGLAAVAVFGGILVLGGLMMLNLRVYWFVIVAVVLAMLPWSPHFLIGLPVGLWALLILLRPEVKAAFLGSPPRPAVAEPPEPPPLVQEVGERAGFFKATLHVLLRLATSPTSYGVLLCLLGIAAALLPWASVTLYTPTGGEVEYPARPGYPEYAPAPAGSTWGWQWFSGVGFSHGIAVGLAFLMVGLFLIGTDTVLRLWRPAFYMVAAIAVIATTAGYFEWARGLHDRVEVEFTMPQGTAMWEKRTQYEMGPYLAIAVAGGLLVLGAVETRNLLAGAPAGAAREPYEIKNILKIAVFGLVVVAWIGLAIGLTVYAFDKPWRYQSHRYGNYYGSNEVQRDPGTLSAYRGQVGAAYYFEVTGNNMGSVYGDSIYTDDSSLATAVVHAGILRPGQRGVVRVTILPDQGSYPSVTRNGVTSYSWGNWHGCYRIEGVSSAEELRLGRARLYDLSPDGPTLNPKAAAQLRLMPEQVPAVNKIIQDIFREYYQLEEKHTKRAFDNNGRLHVSIEAFPSELLALEERLQTELKQVLDPGQQQLAKEHVRLQGSPFDFGYGRVEIDIWKDSLGFHWEMTYPPLTAPSEGSAAPVLPKRLERFWKPVTEEKPPPME